MAHFKPDSQMTFATVEASRRSLVDCLKSSRDAELIIDLSGVQHCDSAGLALLIEAQRLCRQWHKRCQIHPVPPSVLALATFYGLESIVADKAG